MCPLRCGVVLEEQPFRLFRVERTLQRRTFRHFSGLNTVIIVHCCPRRQDVQKSNAYPHPTQSSRYTLSSRRPLVFLLLWWHLLPPSRWSPLEFGFRILDPAVIPGDNLWQEGFTFFNRSLQSVSGDCILASCVNVSAFTAPFQHRPVLCYVASKQQDLSWPAELPSSSKKGPRCL
jgi:hypothetical protein